MGNFIENWTWEIKDDGSEFKPMKPGIYPAIISRFEQAEHLGSPKIPPCPKAILTLAVDSGEGTVDVKTTLLVHRKMEWKLSEFFRSIGRKRHGEPLQMDWSNLVGQKLLVKIAPRTYPGSDGETRVTNNVERFLDYNPDAFPKDPDWMKEAMAADVQDDELDDIF